MSWYVLGINPEPWAIGPVGYARRGGKMSAYVGRNQQLDSYKEAVREELGTRQMIEGPVHLEFFFWRKRSDYENAQAKRHRKNEADTTNLQKATEDALQGVLFKNDKDVSSVHSYMVDQGPDVTGMIVIRARAAWIDPLSQIPSDIIDVMADLHAKLRYPDEPADQSHDQKPEELF